MHRSAYFRRDFSSANKLEPIASLGETAGGRWSTEISIRHEQGTFLLRLTQRKSRRRTRSPHFTMKLQEQRSVCNTNEYRPLTTRGRRILPTTAAPGMRLWLQSGPLPLLMLFSALQTPIWSSEVGRDPFLVTTFK